MRIAILGTRYSPPFIRGGEEAVIHELKREFERRGHLVHVYTPAFCKWRELDAASSATHTYRLPVRSIPFFYHVQFAGKLREALAGKSYDVYLNTHTNLGHGLDRHPHVVVVASNERQAASKMSITGPATLAEYVIRRTLASRMEIEVWGRCDRIVGVGAHVVDQLRRLYRVPREKVLSIGNGVDCDKFRPVEGVPKADPPVIFFVGRLVQIKNVDLIIKAAALLRDRGVRFEVHICGDGHQRGPLEALVECGGLSDIVKFLGRVDSDSLPEEYRRAALFALPSRFEGIPMVLLEAQASGLPAIVARFRGAEKIVRDGQTGFIMKENTPAELAEYLQLLVADMALCEKMGREARAVMLTEFSWDKAAREFLRVFEDVLPHARRPPALETAPGGPLPQHHVEKPRQFAR